MADFAAIAGLVSKALPVVDKLIGGGEKPAVQPQASGSGQQSQTFAQAAQISGAKVILPNGQSFSNKSDASGFAQALKTPGAKIMLPNGAIITNAASAQPTAQPAESGPGIGNLLAGAASIGSSVGSMVGKSGGSSGGGGSGSIFDNVPKTQDPNMNPMA